MIEWQMFDLKTTNVTNQSKLETAPGANRNHN